jgi:hypothetical protein
MKILAIWIGVSAVGFVLVGMQIGLFQGRSKAEESASVEEKPPEPPPPPPKVVAKFPEDLAPAAQAVAVPAAAEFKPGSGPHPLVFLRLDGIVHPWQEKVREDWQAESVATTELVVVLGTPKRTKVSHHIYPGNAPPITRYMFELEMSVIEAKTGTILANRLFRNVPRPLMPREAWETTAIGQTVSLQQVFGWVSRMSRSGFPQGHDPNPIVTQMD